MFGKYLESQKEFTKIALVKTPAKMLDWCKICPFYHDFYGLKHIWVFLISKIHKQFCAFLQPTRANIHQY